MFLVALSEYDQVLVESDSEVCLIFYLTNRRTFRFLAILCGKVGATKT